MKISAQQYARSLYDSVSGKSAKEIKLVLKNFVALLGKNRELNRSGEIVRAFNELWNKEYGEVNAVLISARELGPTARETVTNYLKEKTNAKKISLTEAVDGKLLGGFILKYESKILDGSLKTSLENLKNNISN